MTCAASVPAVIDFDDILGGGFVDEEPHDPNDRAIARPVLVVAEKARSPEELEDEERLARYLMAGSPFVIFLEEDEEEPGREIFANARAWAKAMGTLSLPTEAEARAWEAQLITDRILAYAERER